MNKLFALMLVAAAMPAPAQVLYGTLAGTVEDTSGAVVAGAAVKISNEAIGQTRESTTNTAGTFTATNLTPGVYSVDIVLPGFRALPVNDIFNRQQNKYISGDSQPLQWVTGFTYQTPAASGNRWARAITRDWQVGGIFKYASGLPILAPVAQNNLSTLLFRGTFVNRVQGQPLFLKDLNCHCIDPNKDFVLNPAAWSDPASGQFGTAAAYYNDYRYQRRPAESASFGRAFRILESMSFEIRGEFFNMFNRTQINNPDSTNALATPTRNSAGVPASGFGRINAGSLYSNPRSGQLLARFRF